MYTWGYIKEAALAKLDKDVEEAVALGYVNRFYVYANEALAQITAAVRPQIKYAKYKVVDRDKFIEYLQKFYKFNNMNFLYTMNAFNYMDYSEDEQKAYAEYKEFVFIGDDVRLPNDYNAMAVNTQASYHKYEYMYDCNSGYYTILRHNKRDDASSEQFVLKGDYFIEFLEPGEYSIPYQATWFTFTSMTPDDTELNIPADIVTAIPSYIAAQVFKIDDEQKAAIMLNEFEVAVARINDNTSSEPQNIVVGGDW